MASDSAWELGSQIASKNIAARRDRKDKLEDEARQQKVTDLYGRGKNLAISIRSMAQDDPARQKAMDDLTSVEEDIKSIYAPHNGGASALQRDWHLLAGLIHKSRPIPAAAGASFTATTSPGATFTPDAQTITLPETPAYLRSGAAPSAGAPASPASSPITLPSAPVTIPKTTTGQVRSLAAMTPAQRQQYQRREQARTTAEQDVTAAGLSPEQTAQAESAQKLAYVKQAVADYNKFNPDATKEQKAEFLAEVVQSTYGFVQKPSLKLYTLKDGTKAWLDASRPDLIPEGATASGAESTDTRKRADYDAYVKVHPDYKGTYEQWGVEQGQLAKRAVPTNRDDRYIEIQQKKANDPTSLTKDDNDYAAAYDLYINKRVLDPIRTRAAANADDRYVQVFDIYNPDRVTFMRAREAASNPDVASPQSISFQIDKAITKYMIAGKGGENINYFNTAVDHLNLLSEAADALNNGDIQRLNQFGNAFARETGDPAPTNFETVKSAVAGELSKTFKGTGATDAEISQINQEINSSESPAQLHGAIDHYRNLMHGKLEALRQQYEQGKQGRPAFAPATPAAGAGATGGAADQYTYITNGTKTVRAKKGTPVPQGWTVTNAPTQ